MKLLTLNTHSIIDESYDDKIKVFCEAIIKYEPDVIALQEVMQPIAGEKAEKNDLLKGVGCIPVKSGNFAYNVLKCLKKHNSNYHGVYFGIKKAYDKYDEGLAILSNKEINTTEITQLTKFNDYNNWKTRFSLGVRIGEYWFYSLHFNWWDDGDSSFQDEWVRLQETLRSKKRVWLMGDFNVTPRSQGYELITKAYFDTYMLAKDIDNGITVRGKIDGWEKSPLDKRIDYIFTDGNVRIKSSKTIFNSKTEEMISDHFGVLVERE